VGSDTLIGNNSQTAFIAKYNSSGNLMWAKCPNGNSNSIGFGVTTDLYGNIYLAGRFSTTSGLSFDTVTLTCSGVQNIFIVKFNSSGNVIYAKSFGGSGDDESLGVSTDVSGNAYITGFFTSSSISFGSTTLFNTGSQDVYITKLDVNGQVLWSQSANGSNNEEGLSVATDVFGNAYITGFFYSPNLIFGNDTLFNIDNTGTTIDLFLVKYDSLGNVIFAKSAGGTDGDAAYSVATNSLGKIFITGYYSSPSIIFGLDTLFSSASFNSFIVEYDSTGQEDWAKTTSIGSSMGACVVPDDCGNIIIAGRLFSDTLALDTTVISYPYNGDNTYIFQLNSSGNSLWGTALPFGGDENDAIAFDAYNNLYIGGDFNPDTVIIANDTLFRGINEDLFVAKLNFSCITTGTPEINKQPTISIFPNPVTSTSTLQIQSNLTGKVKVNFYNLLGQNILTIEGNDRSIPINRNDFKTGMFFYHISISEQIIGSGKFVVE
jgi:hypothetical protein